MTAKLPTTYTVVDVEFVKSTVGHDGQVVKEHYAPVAATAPETPKNEWDENPVASAAGCALVMLILAGIGSIFLVAIGLCLRMLTAAWGVVTWAAGF